MYSLKLNNILEARSNNNTIAGNVINTTVALPRYPAIVNGTGENFNHLSLTGPTGSIPIIYDNVLIPLFGEACEIYPYKKSKRQNDYNEIIYVWIKK